MRGQEAVEPGQFGDQVVRVVPGHAAAGMDIDSLLGEPLDTAGEPEAAGDGSEGAEAVAHEGPGAPLGGEAGVVVRFAVVNVKAEAGALAKGIIQAAGHIRTGVILEEFRVGPLHAAFGKERFGGFERAAQAFQEKDRVREFLAHAGFDVLPDAQWDFVAGVATESIHATAAPGQKGAGDFLPQFDIGGTQLHKVFPGDPPSARRDETAVRSMEEPIRVIFIQRGPPAGVVDHHVEEDPAAPAMRGIGQLAELLDTGGPVVEFHQRRVNGREVLAGVGTSETAETRER